jgi:hypothetical protein
MRAISLALILAAAGPAVAAPPLNPGVAPGLQAPTQLELNALRAQQDMAQRQAIARDNEAAALDAQLRAERSVAEVRAQSMTPTIPAPPPGAPPAHLDVSGLASIPDATLADSDAKVRAAAKNRR